MSDDVTARVAQLETSMGRLEERAKGWDKDLSVVTGRVEELTRLRTDVATLNVRMGNVEAGIKAIHDGFVEFREVVDERDEKDRKQREKDRAEDQERRDQERAEARRFKWTYITLAVTILCTLGGAVATVLSSVH